MIIRTKEDVICILRQKVKDYGSQEELANIIECSPQYLSDVLRGRREPGKLITDWLGLKKITVYVVA